MLNRVNLEDSWRYMNRKASPGTDRKTVQDYERNFGENIGDLVERLKQKRYRAKLIKRVNIPKGGGKTRPLGLPALEDKLLQTAVSRILNAIYEEDFLPCSFGYRPGKGPRMTTEALGRELLYGKYDHIVEADIKGFFDNIDHDWLIRMLEMRIDDGAFLRLIRKWLKAGILETDGRVLHPATGTPQGGVISPVLANLYLHHALDLWFEKAVKPRCVGAAYLCRFADDFVCAFQFARDAERFFRVLPKRLKKFSLEVAADKTQMISFSRSNKGKTSFDFLGFEFRRGVSRKGKPIVKRRTSRKKLRTSLKNLNLWCKNRRHLRLPVFFRLLNSKLRGYYNYFGVPGNSERLGEFNQHARRILYKWLNRRSQKRSFNWTVFAEILTHYRLEPPRIRKPGDVQFLLSLR